MVTDRDRYRLLWIITILVSIATFVSVTALALRDPGPPLPVLARVPSFTLRDQRSQTVTRETLAGRPFIVDFFFSSCPTSCPKQAERMAALQKDIREKDLPVQLVSISVDPETDTPARLAEYAAKWGADAKRWSFLTGGNTALERAFVGAYELACRKPSERGDADVTQIMHGDWFVLVDGEGRIRGFYDSRERRQLRQLLIDAERVIRDPSIALAPPIRATLRT
jgi:protein SCO1/2